MISLNLYMCNEILRDRDFEIRSYLVMCECA